MCCGCMCAFYVDLLSSFMLSHYDRFVHYLGTKHQKEPNILTKKVRILLLRLGIGYLINIALFLVVCFVNRKTKDEGDGGFLLFCAIVIFAVCFYAFITFSLVYRLSRFSSNVDDPRAEYKVLKYQKFMMVYKCLDVIFDISVLLYSFILADWDLTKFTIAATALLCTDIVLNSIVLTTNCCSDEEKSNHPDGSSENNQAFETGEIQEHRSVVRDHRDVNMEEGMPQQEQDFERVSLKSVKLPDNSVIRRSNKETDYQQKLENQDKFGHTKDMKDMENSSEEEKSSDFVPEPVATSNLDTSSDWVSESN